MDKRTQYIDFLKQKVEIAPETGLSIDVPLIQFDIVDRVIERYSNPGELVDDPFHGIGTVSFRAMKLKRKGFGVELNSEYWRDGLSHLRAAELDVDAPTLFDLIET